MVGPALTLYPFQMLNRMSNVVFLRIMYRNAVNLHGVTSIIESVKGLRIKHLNFINRGRDFVGVVAFETARKEDVPHLIHLLRINSDISKVEKVSKGILSY